MDMGRIGIWSRELRNGERGAVLDAAVELDELGYGAIWMPGAARRGFFELAEAMLAATERIVVASGILNIWTSTPTELAAEHAALTAAHPGRFLLGLGVSHAHIVEKLTDRAYERPLSVMRAWLDDLDAARQAVPPGERVLAALGPRMLRLSAERSVGAHPYFVPLAHTRMARAVLGQGPLLAPEQAVVLEADVARARSIARRHVDGYVRLPNYAANLRRCGLTDADLADGGSERLVDEVVAWGDAEAVASRLDGHLAAGADHVCVQVLPEVEGTLPTSGWRVLANALGSRGLLRA